MSGDKSDKKNKEIEKEKETKNEDISLEEVEWFPLEGI
jgi:hypothetical protein